MELFISIGTILVASIAIYFLGSRFAIASSRIGDYLKLDRAVKGATLDAIASSLPELLVALFAVIFFNSFEVGVGTIAGSALFNLLVIPGIAVLVAPVAFRVSKRVITRDALFYVISTFILVVITFYFHTWGIGLALFLLMVYVHYVSTIRRHSRGDKEEDAVRKELDEKVSINKEFGIATLLIVSIGAVTYFLTEASLNLGEILDVSPVIIAFVVTAAATSVPDTVISIVNARQGDIDDAASNVFGSNIFDILVGLGLPLLIYSAINGPVVIEFEYTEILFGLLGATIIVLYMIADTRTISRNEGAFLLFVYVAFLAYVMALSFGKGIGVAV
jgi:K+-dependent Na+/Ca+ exchanger-like protein